MGVGGCYVGKVVSWEYRVERALGGAQVQAGELDVVRFPQEAVLTGSPQAGDFPARTWRGGASGTLEGPWPAAPRPGTSATGT